MSNVQVCDFADGLVDEVKKFRFSKEKSSRAIIMKIDVEKQKVMREAYRLPMGIIQFKII